MLRELSPGLEMELWKIYLIVVLQFQYIKTKNMCSKLKWSQEEEQMLRKLGNLESKRKWVEVANQINSLFPEKKRTSKQCREKYINHVQFGSGIDNIKWTEQEEHTLFQKYLEKGSQWKLISGMLIGKSENAVKNKFYGKVRKLVRKLNNICRERINRSNKPLRDESIMRIIDIHEGFENLPQNLVQQSQGLKNDLIFLAEKDMTEFDSWSLIEQDQVVNLIRQIHKFNINSRYYCSRKRKNSNSKKCAKQLPSNAAEPEINEEKNQESREENEEKLVEAQTLKTIPFVPIIVAGLSFCSIAE